MPEIAFIGAVMKCIVNINVNMETLDPYIQNMNKVYGIYPKGDLAKAQALASKLSTKVIFEDFDVLLLIIISYPLHLYPKGSLKLVSLDFTFALSRLNCHFSGCYSPFSYFYVF